ncbi:arsenosugar biosynthesis radical SAM protein ArsS [Geomonas nitrogeniifigens]|uniref:arsenosugar biosynthesis radical SAM (seleno)protein ArsS n=1 Tax=Geomonas diazotrophica TaxID=2843197 RepID=UPI001C2BA627|nr:arsenosugar biosynthesis radical SAM (seleno)protein ArsS [Geomonas nitrogeniifigens]QXE85646.1 arsenosugar biosynthesis radical SAM protein ArsS [Geomonas nitrogeniifigens]
MDVATGRLGESFGERLARHDLSLTRERTTALQVNLGLACDLACGHCHLEAGPARSEMMPRSVMAEVIACARRFRFDSIDLTGGAPELVRDLPYLVRGLAPETQRLILRSNLVSLEGERGEELLQLYRELKVVLVASLPAGNQAQTEAQRGAGVWERSIRALKRLNTLGYGLPGSPLELDLVSNPSGAFLPPPQLQAQEKFRRDLARKHGVSFHNLYTFANVPLGRFRRFLERSGNLDGYLEKLSVGFNPCAVAGLMCRSQLSVDWCGRLYDCDFHLAQGIFHGGGERLISALTELPPPGTPIPSADHCYACTVGSGFT